MEIGDENPTQIYSIQYLYLENALLYSYNICISRRYRVYVDNMLLYVEVLEGSFDEFDKIITPMP